MGQITKISHRSRRKKINLQYEIPKATICFEQYFMNVKFAVGDIPIRGILENPFLAIVEPHGLARLEYGRSGYFISIPNSNGYL